jgi:FHA domain
VSATVTCPNGHESTDPEWCDTCGARIGAVPPAPITSSIPSAGARATTAPGSATPGAPALSCANCGAANSADSLFCESCGYDFTTGQVPLVPPASPSVTTSQPDPVEAAEPMDLHTDWCIYVEIDPVWYRLKGTDSGAPCPPATRTGIPITGHTVLVGRTSRDRQITPEISLNDDPGVSRRHAQFVQDDEGQWSVVDLGSMNGTYIVGPGTLPDEATPPLVQGEPMSATDGSSVYLGAWTRLTLTDNRPEHPDSPASTEPTEASA